MFRGAYPALPASACLYPTFFHWLPLGKQFKSISSLPDGGEIGREASSCPMTAQMQLIDLGHQLCAPLQNPFSGN